MSLDPLVLGYFLPMAGIWLVYAGARRRTETENIAVRDAVIKDGLTEPSSLHPVIDPAKCLGCGSCVSACPEGRILGLIDGKAHLIEPTRCIGHSACAKACPLDAITLVFGTAKRGIDIPEVNEEFETNVPGLYIAGELGGMGLIRNAIEQGRQAMDYLSRHTVTKNSDMLDVIVVGAGPAGFSASLAAKEKGLDFITLEQESLGGTVSHYPRGKLVMTAPAVLPIVGQVNFRETNKEALLEFWQKVERDTKIKINYHERVDKIIPDEMGFTVTTTKATYSTRAVLLALGRRGTPRKLGVEGEERTKVVYRLIDAEQYKGQHVLVVGGGDSALEAAVSIADEPGTTVTLSYRKDAFGRAKVKNREQVDRAAAEGRLNILFSSNVKTIGDDTVQLEQGGEILNFPNDGIIVCAGGILPTGFLKSIGIEVETKYGTS